MTIRPRIFLTRRLPPESMAILDEHAELTYNQHDRVLTKHELIAGVRQADGLLCLLNDTIDAEAIEANPDLKVISNFAVGFNNINVAAATSRSLPVTNTPGVLTETTADMAFALLMAAARRLVEADGFVRKRQWKGWEPLQFLGHEINGSTLGLIGLGRIGKEMVRRAQGFNMRVLYWNRTRLDSVQESELGLSYGSMEDVLRESDFVSVHVALNESTRHLIAAPELGQMKPTGILINTSRGPVIDEHALVRALRSGSIAAAALDVYENEPRLEEGLYDLPNVVLAPHLGSATLQTRTKMGNMAAHDCLAACKGIRPNNLVNPEVWPEE